MEIFYIILSVPAILLLFAMVLSIRSNRDMKAWELILVRKAQEDESHDAMENGIYDSLLITRNHALNLKKENHELKMEVAYYRGLMGLDHHTKQAS